MTIREELTQAIKCLSESKVCDLDENIENVIELLGSRLGVIESVLETLKENTTDSKIESALHELYMSI